jgi:hypothetical protein
MLRHSLAIALPASAIALISATAHADEQSIIKQYGEHPSYVFEAEPHVTLGFGYPFDDNNWLGLGFRGTFHITNGFVPRINDSIGIGVGFDFAPGGPGYFFIPVVMQWNFWLTTHFSVFGEPGIGFTNATHNGVVDPFIFYAGGRYHFNERIALTLRLGYPDITVGASFFF